MNLQMIGCSHKLAGFDARERLTFTTPEAGAALDLWQTRFPTAEAVLLSTCNRVELYTAAEGPDELPGNEVMAGFLAETRRIEPELIRPSLVANQGRQTVEHLFAVASSLDSMVVGEAQIVAQVKQAYELADRRGTTGPLTHSVFQAALRTARRVASETAIGRRRVSIPSVAIADFATRVFESFHDKRVLVLGAGEMAEETLEHLVARGTRNFVVCNRTVERARELADRFGGRAPAWEHRWDEMIDADLVIAAMSASEPLVAAAEFAARVVPERAQRPLFMLDLAVPRNIEAAVGEELGVYLYSIDDLHEACEQNLQKRQAELPAAQQIVMEETERFMVEYYHRISGPTITRLRREWQEPKEDELRRLLNKLPHLDERSRQEITHSFDRLVNKLLHPPLESLRDESRHGPPHGLLDALKRLFQLED
jgi:glutamyl-tRNA reductase